MKRLAFAASMFVLAACAKKEEAIVDSAAPAVVPAPVDTMRMDTMKMDTTTDTTKH